MISSIIFKVLPVGFLLLGFATPPVHAQTRISGFVRDKQSGERLIEANILDIGEKVGTTTDNSGYFSLVVKIPCALRISYVGYKPLDLEFKIHTDAVIEANLEPGQDLDAVVITSARKPIPNLLRLRISELSQLPALGGKTDVLKSLQLLPGIQTQNEGSSLLLVRGGDPGQNLYLFDNVPVIYVNHLGGFMSVFNPDIINSIDLYKGSFPARYGGRLSSVVDITQREGNKKALKGSLGFGITDLSFSLEGPTKLRNSSFILTGRKTLTDPLLYFFTWISQANDFIMGYGFHDVNGKFTWKPDERNSLHVNLYQGDDYMNYWAVIKTDAGKENGHLKNAWGNWLASGRWDRVLSPRVLMTHILSYTRYRLNLYQNYTVTDSIKHSVFDRNYLSSVEDFSLRSNFRVQVSTGWSIESGLQASGLTHTPNDYFQSNLAVQPAGEKLKAFESALYLDNTIVPAGWMQADLGLRLVYYGTNAMRSISLEPRAKLRFKISPDQFLHLSYHRVTQNEHLLFTAGSIMNSEVWVPVGEGIQPAGSEQYTLGWNGSFLNGRYTAEICGYFKTLENLAAYREGYSNLLGDTDWRSKLVTGGTGRSKGVEFLLKKQHGNWTGFVSYAWSRTTRKFPQINKGLVYTFDFDRPHTASLNINHKFNEKWSLNLVWVYQTGLPFTPVMGRQLTLNTDPDENGNFQYYEVLLYGERNSARMKDYHRLDIGFSLDTVTRNNRKVLWTFSVYNLYNRHNPYYYYYNTDASGGYNRPENLTDFKPMNLYQMSFFPIIPTVSVKVFLVEKAARIGKKTKNREKENHCNKNNPDQ